MHINKKGKYKKNVQNYIALAHFSKHLTFNENK